MELPEDVLNEIREFSLPRTRADWRKCKRFESCKIEQYYAYGRFMLHALQWFSVTDENGNRMFYNKQDVARHLCETNMVNRIIRFGEKVPLEIDMMDLLYAWFDRNWALGLAALPM
jgi:hypothetical protein